MSKTTNHTLKESDTSKAQVFVDFLTKEGFRPELEDDGDVRLKAEGRTVFLTLDENDEDFLRILHPIFWSIKDEAEHKLAEEVASEVSKRIKTAKVFVVKDNVLSTVELFCSPLENICSVLIRSIYVVLQARRLFAEEMRRRKSEG